MIFFSFFYVFRRRTQRVEGDDDEEGIDTKNSMTSHGVKDEFVGGM